MNNECLEEALNERRLMRVLSRLAKLIYLGRDEDGWIRKEREGAARFNVRNGEVVRMEIQQEAAQAILNYEQSQVWSLTNS